MIRNPIPWPNGAKCACAITFDMDADSLIHISRPDDAHDRLYPITMGRYGPTVAIPRILDTYDADGDQAVVLHSGLVHGAVSGCGGDDPERGP
jgi:hypothetical protein